MGILLITGYDCSAGFRQALQSQGQRLLIFQTEDNMTLQSIGHIGRQCGVSPSTIRRWCAQGKLQCCRTLGGHRRFEVCEQEHTQETTPGRMVVGYVRVSSHGQKDDLDRQVQRQKLHGCDWIISDIGSGLNCCKPGLKLLMNLLIEGRVERLAVVQEDWLRRFGVNLIRHICTRRHMVVIVWDSSAITSFEEEEAIKMVRKARPALLKEVSAVVNEGIQLRQEEGAGANSRKATFRGTEMPRQMVRHRLMIGRID